MIKKVLFVLLTISLFGGCKEKQVPKDIDLSKGWRFAPDEKNLGVGENWFASDFDDSAWDTIDAGDKWENQGYPDLDATGWYRKSVDIPKIWKGNPAWIKFEAVNDAYTLYINGKEISFFGEANISVASRPTFTEISKHLRYGKTNQITLKVDDWGGSGGLWRLPVVLTSNENEVSNIFEPMVPEPFTPEQLGYRLVWEDQFDGTELDSQKWEPRGIGPRAAGYISADAIKVHNGFLELYALDENDSLKVGAVGTQHTYLTRYGYFECRAQLQKSKGNWAAFWIQSPGIASGEDPGKFGTEIDIMEFFKKSGDDMVSHNLHWAYGPNQQSIGGLLSHREGVSEGFHTFAAEWTPEKYAFYIDGYKYYEVNRAISHIEQYMVLSMELPSKKEDMNDSTLPDVFIVDYVRVYKKK
ncbi:MAG: family 16 glycosylhydrolase [Mariniphaga sp.]